MKKYLFPLLVVVVLVAGFTSCKPDDEIFDPKCKISKIWYRSDVGSPNEIYLYDKKGNLEEIIIDDLDFFNFFYNKDKTVSEIEHKGEAYTEKIEFSWTDRLVDKIAYSIDGVEHLTYTFYRHTDKKDPARERIDYIEVKYDPVFYDSLFFNPKNIKHPLYDKVFGDYKHIADIMAKNNVKGQDLEIYSVKHFTYAPGKNKKYENIEKLVEEFPTLNTVITHIYSYQYDSIVPVVYNPFYGLPYAYADIKGYSLNLPVSEYVERVVASSTYEENITYIYEGKHFMNDKHYPRQFKTISSDNNIPYYTYILYKK